MPRPPQLPVPDRKAIFNNGVTYTQWLDNPDEQAHREKILAFEKTTTVSNEVIDELGCLERVVNIIAIAETWCGDVMRHVPLINKLSELSNGKVNVRFISRDAAPDFFIRFLTNGGEALPKLVFCNGEFTEVGNWGPMSETPKRFIAEGKAVGDVGTARKKVSAFYEKNNGEEATKEIVSLIKRASLTELPV